MKTAFELSQMDYYERLNVKKMILFNMLKKRIINFHVNIILIDCHR